MAVEPRSEGDSGSANHEHSPRRSVLLGFGPAQDSHRLVGRCVSNAKLD